jgi:hypothetical protein
MKVPQSSKSHKGEASHSIYAFDKNVMFCVSPAGSSIDEGLDLFFEACLTIVDGLCYRTIPLGNGNALLLISLLFWHNVSLLFRHNGAGVVYLGTR